MFAAWLKPTTTSRLSQGSRRGRKGVSCNGGQSGPAPTSSLDPQRHCFGVMSKAGGMEKLLLLALSLVQVCRATQPAGHCGVSLSIWAVQVHLTTDRISPNMGQEFKF